MTRHNKISKLFVPHGRFDAYVDGRLVISQVTGPRNKELVDEWALALYSLAKAVCTDGPHGGVAVIHGSMLCPPDAMDALRNVIAYSVRNMDNVAHVIVADSTIEGRTLLAPVFAKLYEGLVPYRMFDALPRQRNGPIGC